MSPDSFIVGEKAFKLEKFYPIRSLSGTILQNVCIYSCEGEIVTAYANADMRFGMNPLPALLPSADLINKSSDGTVLLCLSPDVTRYFIQFAKEHNIAKHTGIIVTGSFGGLTELEALDLSDLAYHNVVLICSPDRAEWAGIENLGKRCLQHGASTVKIYPWPIQE